MPVISLVLYLVALALAGAGGGLVFQQFQASGLPPIDVSTFGETELRVLTGYQTGGTLLAAALVVWIVGFVCHRLNQIKRLLKRQLAELGDEY